MKRALWFLTFTLLTFAFAWGCSPETYPDDDDDDGGSGGQMCGGLASCNGNCVNTQTDNSNCGTCGNACAVGQTCSGGMCKCSGQFTSCGNACVNTTSDPRNCGGCGTVCGSAAPFCGPTGCTASCSAPTTQCGNSCVNTSTDLLNCGSCNVACTGGRQCGGGMCLCGAGQEWCATSGSCVAPGSCGGGVGGSAGAGGSSGAGGSAAGSAGAGGSTAGSAGAGGSTAGSGGSAGGGAGTAGGDPAGYWRNKDWHGCAWTGVGTDGISTIAPMDFVSKAADAAYCVAGTVGEEPAYKSVALLGFNVNEPNTASCTYKPVDVTADGPPSTMITAQGLAVNFVKRGTNTGFTLRAQIQGPNGHKAGAAGEADRWCATITEVQGKVFVPWSSFTPKCWEMTPAMQGTPYANQPISAVVFLVPGALTDTPFDFCINGFTYGATADDAPDGPEQVGDQTGTVGGTGSMDLDFDRKKVTVGGENYIIQNNNWGNPNGSDCILSYLNNSFTVTTCNGSGSSAPAAFPSIYIGNNGNTANGVLSTKSSDMLPRQISAITSATSTFRYSGANGALNAAYDIWFAASPPAAEYNDGIDGFVMVWLRDPPGFQPIGSNQGSVMVAGQAWNVWVGPRGDGPEGYNDAPVVSFVNPAENDNSRSQSFVNVNLKEFFTAAAAHGIGANLYLTDVFAGFEIWNGGVGAKVDEYKTVVQ
jgi:hypothetical protein